MSQSHTILMGVLERCSNYFKAVNSLARIIGWKKKDFDMEELQSLATSAFFIECKKKAAANVENFRGNGFYTLKKENIMYVKGRETDNGATVFKLVPLSTMLYTKIAETFHKKYHIIGGSPVYI